MNVKIKNKLLLKHFLIIAVAVAMALILYNVIPYQLSKLPILNGKEIKFPPNILYMLVFALTLKPILNLLSTLILIRKWRRGDNPSCPSCSYPMVRRVAKKGKYSGQEFWGCLTFPRCAGKIHIG